MSTNCRNNKPMQIPTLLGWQTNYSFKIHVFAPIYTLFPLLLGSKTWEATLRVFRASHVIYFNTSREKNIARLSGYFGQHHISIETCTFLCRHHCRRVNPTIVGWYKPDLNFLRSKIFTYVAPCKFTKEIPIIRTPKPTLKCSMIMID